MDWKFLAVFSTIFVVECRVCAASRMQYIPHGIDLPHDKIVPVLHINKIFMKFSRLCFCFFLITIATSKSLLAQHDSLVLNNGDKVVGEIKSMDKGVLTIETNYSKKDFTIEWSGVKEIYSKTFFMITLSDGRRFNARIQSVPGEKKLSVVTSDNQTIETTQDQIVFLKGLKSDFWSRMKASVDLGLSFTKANNLRQISMNSAAGYFADKWQADVYFNMIQSTRDSVSTTKRIDAGINYKYFLQNDWYLSSSITFLSNTEQALNLRTSGKLGGGKYLVHTNKTYWNFGSGLAFNNESFTNATPGRNSLEAFGGTELNLFDIGDINLLSSIWVYPSLTESGRWRTDFRFDTKYDLPHDFYIKFNLTLNYDNKPAVVGKETDYVFGFSVGWHL